MVTETIQPIVGTFNKDTGALIGIGPAGVPATTVAAEADESIVIVADGLGDVAFAHLVGDEGTPEEEDAPWGRGREVRVAPGLHPTAVIDLSQSQSITGAGPGATTLVFNKHQTVTAETGVLFALDDRLSKRSIVGRGRLSNFSIDGANNDPETTIYPVHGYYAPQPTNIPEGESAPDGESHSFFETLIAGTTGDAYHIIGRKQMRMIYAKGVSVDGVGLYAKDVNDSKIFGCGFNGKKGAVKIRHMATPKLYAGDSWIPADFNGQGTWDVADQSRMLVDGWEIEGRLIMIGRNFGVQNRWENAFNTFRAINFKLVEGLSPSFTYTRDDASVTGTLNCAIYLEDIDCTIFDGCSFKMDISPDQDVLDARPEYFVQLGTKKTGAGNIAMYPGHVKFMNMSGIVSSRGRFGDTAPALCFTKHYSNRPDLIEWDFPAGGLELIQWNDAAPPRNYIKASPFGAATATTALKADYPMGYLWATLGSGGTLDDVNTTFNIPIAPSLAPAGMAWAFRVWP